MAEAFNCLCAAGTTPLDAAEQYRQARKVQTGRLANVYLPVSLIPDTGGADFEFYNPDDGFCYRIVFTDPILDSAGFVPDGWEVFETTAEHDRLCAGSLPAYYQAVRCGTTKLVDLWVNTADAATLPYTFLHNNVCYVIPTGSTSSTEPGSTEDVPVSKADCADGSCDECHPSNFEDNFLVPLGVGDTISVSACALADYLGVADNAVPDAGTFESGLRNYTYAKGVDGTGATACPCPNLSGSAYTITRQPDDAQPVYRQARRCDSTATADLWRAEADGLPYRFTKAGVSYVVDNLSPSSVTPGTLLDGSETANADCHHTSGQCVGSAFYAGAISSLADGDTAPVSSCWLAAYLGVTPGALPASGTFTESGAVFSYTRGAAGTSGLTCPCEDGGGFVYAVTRNGVPVYRQAVRCSPTTGVSYVTLSDPNDTSQKWFFGGLTPDGIVNVVNPIGPAWEGEWIGGGIKFDPSDGFYTANRANDRMVAGVMIDPLTGNLRPERFPFNRSWVYTDITDPVATHAGASLWDGVGLWGRVGVMLIDSNTPGNNTRTTALPRFTLKQQGDTRTQITAPLWVQDGTIALPAYYKVNGVGYRFAEDTPTSTTVPGSLFDTDAATPCTDCADPSVTGCNARVLGDRLASLPAGWRLTVSSCWLEAFMYQLKGLTAGTSWALASQERFQYGNRWYVYRDAGSAGTYGMQCPCADNGGKKYWVWPADHYVGVYRCDNNAFVSSIVLHNTYLPFFVERAGVRYYAPASGSYALSNANPGGSVITDDLGNLLFDTERTSCA